MTTFAEPNGIKHGDTPDSLESRVARLVLVWVASVFAFLTVLTHLVQIFGVGFKVYVVTGVSTALIVSAVVLWREVGQVRSASPGGRHSVGAFLLAVCLFGALLALVSHRPNADDCFYLPNAAYYARNPAEHMGFEVHFIDSGTGKPFTSYHRCSVPFEYVQAMAAHATGLDILTLYYILTPAFLGLMLPLAWFYLLSRFTKSGHAAVFGSLLICVCLLLMGEQHRSFGNYAFNRIFQGKTVALAIGIPALTALTMDYFRVGSIRTWLSLVALSTALIGCSVASTVMVPLQAIILALAAGVAYVDGGGRRVVRAFLYLCTLVYPAIYAGSILLYSTDELGSESVLHMNWPTTFLPHAKWVLGDPTTMTLLLLGVIAAPIFLKRQDRRFFFVWLVAVIVLYLNPVVAPLLIEFVTTPNAYWRLFYLLPFPLVIGVFGVGLFSYLEGKSLRLRIIVPCILIPTLLFSNLPTAVFRWNTPEEDTWPKPTRLARPGVKIEDLSVALAVLETNPPPGTMLAPDRISRSMAILSSKYRYICYRKDGLLLWFGPNSTRVTQCLSFDRPTSKPSINSFLNGYPQINSVVIRPATEERDRDQMKHVMRSRGFGRVRVAGDMVVFSRQGRRPSSRPSD